MSGSLISSNVTLAQTYDPCSLYDYLGTVQSSVDQESDFIDYSIPENRLIQRGRTCEVIPKSPAYVFGEKVIRPIIDGTKYIWDKLSLVASKTDHLFRFSFIPGAYAQEIEVSSFERIEEIKQSYFPSNIYFPSQTSIYAYLKTHPLTKNIDASVLRFVSEVFDKSIIRQDDRKTQEQSICWFLDANNNSYCSHKRSSSEYMLNWRRFDDGFSEPNFDLICSHKRIIPYKLAPNIAQALLDIALMDMFESRP